MRVLLLAGEPSGDRYAAGIARALRVERPDVELRAMGGAALERVGVERVVDSTRLAVMGLTEVLSRLPELLRARRTLRAVLDDWRPDVIVPIDYPEFNLRIAADARRRGVPVAWFISPQAWAWRPGRIPGIGRRVSRMLVIFPFEVELYERHGIPVEHVGHPLMDFRDPPPPPAAARRELGLSASGEVVALLPGSRRTEVQRTWPVFVEAARRLTAQRPGMSFVVALAPGLDELRLRAVDPAEGLSIRFQPEALVPAIAASDAAVVASGTATLEAALVGRAFVVGYRVSRTTMAIGRLLADRDFLRRGLFALPNVVLGEPVVPELYQERFTADGIASEVASLLDDVERRRRIERRLAELPQRLGGAGTLHRVARAVLETARPTPPR